MGESLSSWLALREQADFTARSSALTQAVAAALSADRPLRVVDLGTGTGSNVRYLTSRLPVPQRWLVVDRDRALLEEVPARMFEWSGGRDVSVETRQMDLGRLGDADIFSAPHLVTASALLDLVSEAWLRTLAGRCREGGSAVLFTLTYNGQSRCVPAEPEDDTIRQLMNRHQKTDKGLGGVAAGPDAAGCAARCFADEGYRIRREPSDWILAPDAGELQRQLIEGWASAAAEISPDQSTMIHQWLGRRLAHVERGSSRVIVGHEDLAAWLPDAGR